MLADRTGSSLKQKEAGFLRGVTKYSKLPQTANITKATFFVHIKLLGYHHCMLCSKRLPAKTIVYSIYYCDAAAEKALS